MIKKIIKYIIYLCFILLRFFFPQKRLLFFAYSPMNYTMFKSLHKKITDSTHTKVYFLLSPDTAYTDYIKLGVPKEYIVKPKVAKWCPWDAVIGADMNRPNIFWKSTFVQIYHGVAAKKIICTDLDGNEVTFDYRYHPELREYDVIFFPNKTDFDNAKKIGVVKPGAYACVVGMTCLDEFYNNSSAVNMPVIRDFFIPEKFADLKTILYAPTWDDSASFKQIGAEILSILASKKYFVIIKPHPKCVDFDIDGSGRSLSEFLSETFSDGNYVVITDTPYQVMAISDCMIGDFSSITFEFSILKRPILLYEGASTYQKVADAHQYEILKKCCYVFKNTFELDELLDLNLINSNDKLSAIDDLLNEYHANLGSATEVAYKHLENLHIILSK